MAVLPAVMVLYFVLLSYLLFRKYRMTMDIGFVFLFIATVMWPILRAIIQHLEQRYLLGANLIESYDDPFMLGLDFHEYMTVRAYVYQYIGAIFMFIAVVKLSKNTKAGAKGSNAKD